MITNGYNPSVFFVYKRAILVNAESTFDEYPKNCTHNQYSKQNCGARFKWP